MVPPAATFGHAETGPGQGAPAHLRAWVHGVGLNFRDVLNVLGMYPGDPGPPGNDFSGVVAAAPATDPAAPGSPQVCAMHRTPGFLGVVAAAPAKDPAAPGPPQVRARHRTPGFSGVVAAAPATDPAALGPPHAPGSDHV